MSRFPVLMSLCTFLAVTAVPTRAGEPASADEVIARYIEAIGGQARLDAVKSLRISGKARAGDGLELPITMEVKEPDKWRTEVRLQGLTLIFACDGQTGWFVNPATGKLDAEKMPPDMLKLMREQNDSFKGPLINYREKGYHVEFAGKEDLEGSPVYKLKVTRKDAAPDEAEYYFIDAEYFLPIRAKGKRRLQQMEIEYEIGFSDYKPVDGLLLAHAIHTQAGPAGPSSVVFEKVEINPEIPDERFRMPPPSSQPASQPAATQPTTTTSPAPGQEPASKKD